MNINTVQGDSIEILLRQIGAKRIEKVRGLLYFIEFELDENLKVSYSYNINSHDNYFLQRIKPYPINQGLFTDEHEIVSFITKDIKKFKNAKNSTNFDTFLDVTKKVNSITHNVEHLFLNYNVSGKDLKNLDKALDTILNEIIYIKDHAKKV
ncbi:hypothetical protein [Asaccharospora irregularis]|uniref:Uncharacterized protein n=1 Tax=Asaccharospora irregularis DSM 2635 TaxID=1121321 RepID=A0A1M5PIK4_9FIRM|nr:hypothetical protein [Asaccharospora irregularis]SHH01558.1 hypothetical protein SAMN04488530_11454 [Asaccharospora irregularis DSM 2635]